MKLFLYFAVVGVLAAGVSPAAAQSNRPRPERPDRALFGGGVGDWEQSVVFTGQIGAGYDDSTIGGGQAPTTPLPGAAAPYTQGAGSLMYTIRRSKVSFNASGGASVAHYRTFDSIRVPTYHGEFGGSFQISRRTMLAAYELITDQPLYSLVRAPQTGGDPQAPLGDPLDTLVTPSDIELPAGSTLESYVRSDSALTLSHMVAKHVTLSVGLTHQQSWANIYSPGFRSDMANGGVGWVIGKGLGLHFNYGYGRAYYRSLIDENEIRSDRQNFDFGLDFQRALSVSRRTKLSFWTATTAMGDGLPGSSETHFRVLGGVRLSREIGRSWGASVSYDRNAEFLDTFAAPVLSDSVIGNFGGLVNRRLKVDTFVGATRGTVGFSGQSNGYTNYYASVGTTFALTRMLALGGSYSYYRYMYETGIALPPGYPPKFDRNSVRAQLIVNVPLFQRVGRPNATR